MTQTALVTGGAGFIGSCVVRQLIGKHRVRVVNVDKLTYAGNLDSLRAVWDDPLHLFVQADIRDSSEIGQLLEEYRPRTIFNLAAGKLNDMAGASETNPNGYLPMLWMFGILSLAGLIFSYLLRKRETGPHAHGLETVRAIGL